MIYPVKPLIKRFLWNPQFRPNADAFQFAAGTEIIYRPLAHAKYFSDFCDRIASLFRSGSWVRWSDFSHKNPPFMCGWGNSTVPLQRYCTNFRQQKQHVLNQILIRSGPIAALSLQTAYFQAALCAISATGAQMHTVCRSCMTPGTEIWPWQFATGICQGADRRHFPFVKCPV